MHHINPFRCYVSSLINNICPITAHLSCFLANVWYLCTMLLSLYMVGYYLRPRHGRFRSFGHFLCMCNHYYTFLSSQAYITLPVCTTFDNPWYVDMILCVLNMYTGIYINACIITLSHRHSGRSLITGHGSSCKTVCSYDNRFILLSIHVLLIRSFIFV